ncbi:MAG TPA: efflux RND transporter periplasmic adaptor subunit [Terriglobales bacterium]|nr:efflux RND transporter periplasmic adaptor subunit [Terriglobales bacterium]
MSRRTHSLLARRLAAGLTLCLGLPGGLFLTACSGTKAAGPAAPGTPVVPVLAATVEEKDVPVQVQAIGSVESYSTVAVKTQITGELTGVFFREGQEVKKGELIFTLDKRPFEAVLKQAQSTLAKDQAQAEMARVQARRYAVLMKDGVVAKEQYDQMQSSADALDAAVEADKAAVENARVQLIYCSIDSPINGRVGSLLIHQGNMIKANDVPLVNINQIQPIRVAFTVPEQYLAEIKRFAANGKLSVQVSIPNDSKPATGKLSFIDNTVDPTTGTIKLKGEFANTDRRLWPGQFVDVVLTLHTQPNAIVVPSQAVNTGQQGQYVFVIKPDMTVETRPVAVNRTTKGQSVIDKGLGPGERVVTDGQLRLVPGSRVQIKEALAPQPGPTNGEYKNSPSAQVIRTQEARS